MKTIKTGQAIKANGAAPTCPPTGGPGGGIILFDPAYRFVGESDRTTLNAVAAIVSRRIACPPNDWPLGQVAT